MAHKQLKASVRLDTQGTEQKLRNIAKAIDAINRAAGNQSNAYAKVVAALSKSSTQTQQVTKQTHNWANAVNKVNLGLNKTGSHVGVLSSKIKQLASAYLGVMGAKAAITTSDTITSSENRLNNLNGGDTKATQNTMDKMYISSQKVRTGYADMMANVSKSMTLAGDAFQGNIDNAIRFQEIMSEAYTIGGASAAEQASSMYQMIQALGSGILQGDELRSIREGAPVAYKAIEEFAQGVYKTEESLKDLASQGLITSEIVVAAMMEAGEGIDKAFEKTEMTFAQAWTQIKNTAIKAFEPVLQRLNAILNSDVGKAIIDGIGQALVFVANAIMWIMDTLGAFFSWVANNWNWIKYIVIGVLTAIIAYYILYTTIVIIQTLIRIGLWIAEHWQMLLTIIIIGAMVAAIVWWANTAAGGIEFVIGALIILGIAIALIGAIFGSMALVVVGILVALAGVIIMFLEYVMGVLFVWFALLYNTFVATINSIIEVVWSAAYPILSIVEWILNACNGGFDSFGGAVANLIGQIISWFLQLGKVVTTIVDAIFGTDWTGGLESLKSSVLKWGKNENAVDLTSEQMPKLERIAYGDAWNEGMSTGESWKASIDDWGSGIQNKINSVTDVGSKFGSLGNFGEFSAGSYSTPSITLPDASDPANKLKSDSYDPKKALKGIGDTADNTGKIADSMDLTEEDLQYLRDVANMEWKREYTTANITVDMSNYNTINGETDLDGIVTKLSDKLYEEMDYLANGVY